MSEKPPSKAVLLKLEKELKLLDERRKYGQLENFIPYPKQHEFFVAGVDFKERFYRAGNQQGKTEAGAYEMALHLTGLYPGDWKGRRFKKAVKAWACGVTGIAVRRGPQTKLCGPPGLDSLLGTGFIPKKCIVGTPSKSRSATDMIDTIHIQHAGGGISSLTFMSYVQSRETFQGDSMDVIWLDEEPPMSIYSECLARTFATGGIVYTTFTPLGGITELFLRFAKGGPGMKEIHARMSDCPHMTPELVAEALAGTPAFEHDSRINGEPLQGEGRVFSTDPSSIAEPAMVIVPPHWAKLWGIDFGIAHPFAAVLIAIDLDKDEIHVLDCFRISDQTPLQHAYRIRQIAIDVPIVWPQDGVQREKSSGESLASLYKAHGLKMCDGHATFEDGGYSTEAGVLDMDQRFKDGRLKVASHLTEWFEEYRNYHRKDGLIVKERDDLMSATRIAVMAKRFARAGAFGNRRKDRSGGIARIAQGVSEWFGED